MVGLEAGEYESVVLERGGQFGGGLGIDGRIDGAVKRVVRLLDERSHGGAASISGEKPPRAKTSRTARSNTSRLNSTSDTSGEG